MVPREDATTDYRTFEIVGRIRPETAIEALESPMWILHGIVEDPESGRPATVLRHVRHAQILLVEEPEELTVPVADPRSKDPEDRPGPWPDA